MQQHFQNYKGVTAWKDVSVKWSNDGRLHFIGTAYFDRLDDINPSGEEDLMLNSR